MFINFSLKLSFCSLISKSMPFFLLKQTKHHIYNLNPTYKNPIYHNHVFDSNKDFFSFNSN